MFRIVVALLALVAFAAPTHAQNWPARPIRLIVPFPPGGGTDFVARTLANDLAKSTGWTIVVDNKAGASGTIGLVEASRASKEGYDIVIGQADNMIIAAGMMKSPGLDPLKDLTPVAQVAISASLFMTQADSKYKSLADLIAAAKANPNAISYGTAGHGTFPQLAAELLMKEGGFKMTEVPYKGAAPAMTDLLGGQTQMTALSVASGMPHIQGGKVRGLAVTSLKRSAALPDVPTVAESGFPGFEAVGWLGILVPNGTPPAVVAKLNAEIVKVTQSADYRKALLAQGVEAHGGTPEEFGAMMKRESDKWRKVMRDIGIQPE